MGFTHLRADEIPVAKPPGCAPLMLGTCKQAPELGTLGQVMAAGTPRRTKNMG